MTQSVLPKSAVNRASPSADAATQLESASNKQRHIDISLAVASQVAVDSRQHAGTSPELPTRQALGLYRLHWQHPRPC